MNRHFKNSGFTLLEVLVTIVIIGFISLVASSVIFSLLRGAAKTETLKEVKQNGDYALSVMELRIRNARSIINPSVCAGSQLTSVTILNPDTTQSTFQCNAANGRIEEVVVGGTSPGTKSLTSTSVVIATSPPCQFTCTTSSTSGKNSVFIEFTLRQASAVPTAEGASVTFETQVALRN